MLKISWLPTLGIGMAATQGAISSGASTNRSRGKLARIHASMATSSFGATAERNSGRADFPSFQNCA
jgi:hypothetical protein